MSTLADVSEYRDDLLMVTFGEPFDGKHAHEGKRLMSVRYAGTPTGLYLEVEEREYIGEVMPMYHVVDRKDLGWFAVRGEAVKAALTEAFDSDDASEVRWAPFAFAIDLEGRTYPSSEQGDRS